MPDKVEGEVTVSQVDQIGAIFSDFAPAAPAGVQKEESKEVPKEESKEVPKEGLKEVPKEVPKEESKETPESSETIKALAEQVKALTAKITELSAPKKEEPVKKEEPKPEVVTGLGFFKDKAEYEAAFEKPEVMSEVMGRVRTSAIQEVLKALPQVINHTVKAQIEVQTKTAKFYADNEDLTGQKQFVGYVANDLAGKNPDWTLDKLYTELPKEVRTRLGLKEGVKKEVTPAQPPKKSGARVPGEKKPDMTPLETEISDLMV